MTSNPFEEALGRLVAQIRSGEIAPGERLPAERELADTLGISRATVRNVIRALQQAKYIRTERGRSGGSFVVYEPSIDTSIGFSSDIKRRLLDALVFRSVLEPGAASLAASKELSPEQSERLQALLAATSGAVGATFRRCDLELHTYIGELAGCTALVDAITTVQLMLNDTLLHVVPVMAPAVISSHAQHEEIVAAIIDGDPGRARDAMAEHVGGTTELVRAFLN